MPERHPIEIPDRTWRVWMVGFSLFLALIRVGALHGSTFNLLPDEAQYWSWSRHPAFGYFSKPPLVAWLIALSTGLAGNEEWAVRLAAPFLHAGTGVVVGFLGARLFGARAGFWAAALYATLPGVDYSALIISTDVPLLFFWALALLALWRLLERPNAGWATVLGAALGLGLLSKYAMAYFLIGMAVAILLGPRAPWRAAARVLPLSGLVAVAILIPNLAWNAAHGWATVGHTAANAHWGDQGGATVRETLAFAAAQFGVFGPVLMLALLARVALWRRDPPPAAERFLLAFALPVLALMVVQSGISRAHANWAAVSYVAGTLLVVGWLGRLSRFWPIGLSLALQAALFALFTFLFANPGRVTLPKAADIFFQMRGWHELGQLAEGAMRTMPAGASLAADDREVMAELDYYTRERTFPLVMTVGEGPPGNQYELSDRIDAQTGNRAVLIARWPDRTEILGRFATHALLEEWSVRAGEGRSRHYYVYDVAGFRG